MNGSIQHLIDVYPLDQAMPQLVVSRPITDPMLLTTAREVIFDLEESPALQAAAWLYLDDLDASHEISQGIATPIGSFWHGILHRREGDFSNAKYWFALAGEVIPGYDAIAFVDEVAAAVGNPADLVDRQRQEWLAAVEAS